jgi:hypothetical protein
MDENTYIKFITDQVKALQASASTALPAGHPAVATLAACAAQLENPNFVPDFQEREPVLPNGFTQEAYDAFLQEQAVVFPEQGADGLKANILDVVGVVYDGDTAVEVGDIEARAAEARAQVADLREDGEDIEVENAFTVTYTRHDGKELTVEDAYKIVNDRQSATLRHLGKIQLIDVKPGDADNKKNVVFAVLETGDIPLEALALNITAYRGTVIIPGLGRVEAAGTVNFL